MKGTSTTMSFKKEHKQAYPYKKEGNKSEGELLKIFYVLGILHKN